jgi:hypothetical protein
LPGPATVQLADGVALLRPDDQVFAAIDEESLR